MCEEKSDENANKEENTPKNEDNILKENEISN